MDTKRKIAIVSIVLLGTFLGISSVGAFFGNGYARTDHIIVDTNNNGIADGLEDFDGDGILNRDDSDFEKTYVNMRDDDGDGIPNRLDSDFVRPQDGTGRGYGRGQGQGRGYGRMR